MIFNSKEFIFIFFPVVFIGYFYFNQRKYTVASKFWLVLASLLFYAYWNKTYLPLLIFSILVNYAVGRLIAASKSALKRKWLLQAGIVFNVALLCYFKYMDFFISNINVAFNANIPAMNIVLPLGISFYTITQVAYLVDAYRGLVKETKFINYALFVTFFPHLLAGPILHHRDIIPQFDDVRRKILNYKNVATGFFLFTLGLFKKTVIADAFSRLVFTAFDKSLSLNFVDAWVASLSFTMQIYFDFSGYTDMALGLALFFNIRLPVNFNSPYKSTGVIEFWQKWHMTLSSFIEAYIFRPMCRSYRKFTFAKAMFALFFALIVAGFWHGASWHFIAFGAIHGCALIVNHIWRKTKLSMPRWLGWFLTFNFINATLVIFRANNLDDTLKVYSGMLGINGFQHATAVSLEFNSIVGITLVVAMLASFFSINSMQIADKMFSRHVDTVKASGGGSFMSKFKIRPAIPIAVLHVFLAVMVAMSVGGSGEFIYFRF
jgi:alginate O-acetyltransferase complex protein AlgI